MSIGLVLMVKDEERTLPRSLASVKLLIDTWTVMDTGSTDGTKEVLFDCVGEKPGELIEAEWVDFATNRTDLLRHAKGSADWLLTLDADMEAQAHPDLRDWLADDPSPGTDAWMVQIRDGSMRWRLPWLIRGNLDWEYRGVWHEYLNVAERNVRWLLGLDLVHFRGGRPTPERLEAEIDGLREGFLNSDPRATFYTAQALRQLGRHAEAALAYKTRAGMGDWEEEAWYSAYMAAALDADVSALYAAWQRRPWRHEPLTEAARLVRERGSGDDVLFVEQD